VPQTREFALRVKLYKRYKLVGLLVCLGLAGLGVTTLVWPKPATVQETPAQTAAPVTYSTNEPDESLANAQEYAWTGGAEQPKKIRIASLGIDAFVQNMGVDQNNQIAVPTNVHLAGWFNQSALPASSGIAVIVGHVSGRENGGVFKDLGNIRIGTVVNVEQGDGTLRGYEVVSLRTVKESEATSYIFSAEVGVASQLNLVTCAGVYDEVLESYPDRVIVSTKAL
jgi:sortase (surface protein transpeptidase)